MGSATPNFTPADLVRSVNKRLRQTYLKKRLMTTYKALERMNQSGFNLEKLKDVVVNEAEVVSLLPICHKKEAAVVASACNTVSQLGAASTASVKGGEAAAVTGSKKLVTRSTLSSKEIAMDRGKPLSRYDRNVMIFDWLYSLDETATIDVT